MASAYRDKFVGLASFNAGQRPHLTHPSRNKITFVTIYDAPCEMLESVIHHRLRKYCFFFPSVAANSMIFQEFLTAYGTYEWTFIRLSLPF